MSQNTFLGDIGHMLTAPFKKAPAPPTLQTPNALSTTPTQAEASAAASKKTLDREQQQASTSTILNGGQGLLDEPTTTSRSLMGA